jgi:ribosomal protein S1
MIWDKIKNIIHSKFGKSDKHNWREKQIEDLETKQSENVNLPFKIVDLKSKGFLVKVSGLYAFIGFYYMPWEYSDINYWITVFPSLIGKVFFCRIHHIKKDPVLSIIVDGTIHQFKYIELLIGKDYRGIILKKVKNGLFIDIGFHFDWRYGSFVGFLPKSDFSSKYVFSTCKIGDEIELSYCGVDESGQFFHFQTREASDWDNGIPQRLLGQIVLVHVVREEDNPVARLLVNGKYSGSMVYDYGSRISKRKIKNTLKDGEIIHCEVVGSIIEKRILKLRWVTELDATLFETEDMNKSDKTTRIQRNMIADSLENDTLQKLISIRNNME